MINDVQASALPPVYLSLMKVCFELGWSLDAQDAQAVVHGLQDDGWYIVPHWRVKEE